jgi:hypothetical protein
VYAAEGTEEVVRHEDPKIVKIQHRCQSITVPVPERDSMADVCLLIETLLKLKGQWHTRDGLAQPVTQVTQFQHQGKYTIHLISEKRARARTLIKRGGLAQEKDYIALLEASVPRAAEYTSDPDLMREISSRRGIAEDQLRPSCESRNWDANQGLAAVTQWQSLRRRFRE